MARRFQTLVELLEWRAERQPSQTAFTFLSSGGANESQLTYAELDRKARRIAAELGERSAAGSRVLLLYPSGLEYISAFFGCLYAGAIAVPVYPPRANRSASRLGAIAHDAKATLALTTQSTRSRTQGAMAELPALTALDWIETDQLEEGEIDRPRRVRLNEDSIAFLQYTSGSTATPKGVVLRHENLLHNERMMFAAFQNAERFACVGWLPLYHDMGLIGNVLAPIYAGASCVLMAPETFLMRPVRWLEAISRYRGTTSGGPNFAYELCVDRVTDEQRANLDLRSWEVAFNGAEPVRASTIDRFSEAFERCGFRRQAFRPCYGLAEATLLVASGEVETDPRMLDVDGEALALGRVRPVPPGAAGARRLVGCGRSWLDQTIVIVDPETRTPCAEDRVGEVWVTGPSIARAYWERTETTQEVFEAELPSAPGRRFLRTGDLGFIHQGELYIAGRSKDLIILAGRNLYPQDLERLTEQSHQAVRAGCTAAFSVEVDGAERLVIAAEVDRHFRPLEDVRQAIRTRLSADEAVSAHAIVLLRQGTIPRTSSGKIQRHACKDGFLRGTLELSEED